METCKPSPRLVAELSPAAYELRAAAARITRETRLEQGLQATITDPEVISRLATLIDPRRTSGGS